MNMSVPDPWQNRSAGGGGSSLHFQAQVSSISTQFPSNREMKSKERRRWKRKRDLYRLREKQKDRRERDTVWYGTSLHFQAQVSSISTQLPSIKERYIKKGKER